MVFNPEDLPLDSVANDGVVEPHLLSAAWLRDRFSAMPEWTPELGDEHIRASVHSHRVASVLIPIVVRDSGLTLLFTRRAAHLTDHPGQISFPGGRFEEADTSLVATALRETEEEVGLHRSHIEIIGSLPDYHTVSGYSVTPVVGLIQPSFELRIDPEEVESVFEVPLVFLMDAQHHQRRVLTVPGDAAQRRFYAIAYDDYFIWGATAGILRNLFHLLKA